MTLDGSALALEPAPRSVQRARRWVAEVCRTAGRDDLVESAEAGVSELVTNALIHAPGPIDVRVSGTPEHPRIEVHDVSPDPPEAQPGPPPRPAAEPSEEDLDALLEGLDDALLSTVGRGLRIVATSAHLWGAELREDGKVVWFEPAPELRTDLTEAELAGRVYAADQAPTGPREAAGPVEVRLLGADRAGLAGFRRHYLELRRELRLLALAHAAEYPQAERLSALFADFEVALGDLLRTPPPVGATGGSHADLTVRVPREAAAASAQMLRLLDLADEFCRGARLLTLARDAEQVELAHWLLTQVGDQAAGAAPVPWRPSGTREDALARYSTT